MNDVLGSSVRIVTTHINLGISELVQKNSFHFVFTTRYDKLASGKSKRGLVGVVTAVQTLIFKLYR